MKRRFSYPSVLSRAGQYLSVLDGDVGAPTERQKPKLATRRVSILVRTLPYYFFVFPLHGLTKFSPFCTLPSLPRGTKSTSKEKETEPKKTNRQHINQNELKEYAQSMSKYALSQDPNAKQKLDQQKQQLLNK